MSAMDTAKEIVRLGSTAGLSKDVIDLMEKKLVLLTDELEVSNRKNVSLETKVSKLEIENAQLRAQINNPQAIVLDDICTKLLVAIANSPDGVLKEDLFAHFALSTGKGSHVIDQLFNHKFIEVGRVQMGVGAFLFSTPTGREYLNRKGLL
jgi:hypothetical protein